MDDLIPLLDEQERKTTSTDFVINVQPGELSASNRNQGIHRNTLLKDKPREDEMSTFRGQDLAGPSQDDRHSSRLPRTKGDYNANNNGGYSRSESSFSTTGGSSTSSSTDSRSETSPGSSTSPSSVPDLGTQSRVVREIERHLNKGRENASPVSSLNYDGDDDEVDDNKNENSSSSSSANSTTSKSSSSSSGSSTSSSSSPSKKKKKKKYKGIRGLIHRMCKSTPDESRLLKAVLWFPIGCVISLILYFLIIRKMDLDEKNKAVIGAALGAILALTFAFSVQIRCTLSLVLPSFMGKAGRSYVTAFAIIFLINGPITNIIGNTKEVVRSLTCTSALLSNHSKNKWRLRLKPIEGALGDLTKDNFQLNKVARGIQRAFEPLKREIMKNLMEENKLKSEINEVDHMKRQEEEDNNDRRKNKDKDENTVRKIEQAHRNDGEEKDPGKEVEKEWKKKLDLRCQDVFSKGVLRCRQKMKKLERKCRRSIKIIGALLCWPLKITVFCKIVKLLPGAVGASCSSMDVVNPGMGDTFISARATVDDMDQGMKVKMQYKLVGDPEGLDYTPMEEIRAATMHEVEERSAFLKLIFAMIAHVLTFTFLIVFKSAYKYNRHYLSELQYDNVYITKYFKHIDARRKADGKKTLLPLKKFEKKDIIDPMKIRLSKEEKGQINKGSGRLVLRVIIAAVICYMDSILYQVLDIIARNSRVEYHQEGEHVIDIKVFGTGFMSALVRNFLLRFNTNHTLDEVSTNHHCLPRPEETDDVIIGFIFGTYIMVWVFMYFESFGLRMRHVIAGFFYRKREKKRVIHLYNEMFRRRIGYLAHVRKIIRKSIRKREYKKKAGLLVALQRQYPRFCRCLRICKSPVENCIVCEDSPGPGFHLCDTPGCGIGYCRQCWKDCKQRCMACHRGKGSDQDDDDDYGTDSSDLTDSE